MTDDTPTNSGTVPTPIPEVRDEGPGGTDLNMEEGDSQATGTLPDPVPEARDEGPGGTDLS